MTRVSVRLPVLSTESMKHPFRTVVLIVLAGLAFGAAFIQLPYYAVGPGPAQDVLPLIDVEGHPRYDSSGKLIMTTVSWYPVTAIKALRAWVDPSLSIVHRDVLYPPGTTDESERKRSISQMDASKIDATYVVMRSLTDYPADHGDGALIETTVEGCPAFDRLFSGDLILAIDGADVASTKQASKAIDAVPADEPITFTVEAADQTHDISLTRQHCVEDDPDPLVGISMVPSFPFPVEISSGNVGGPSAGLMFALGLYDTLTPGDLTAGRVVAGTGEIARDGTVGPIGGIEDKVIAAERVGASVFLVPEDNMAELDGVDTGDMRLISVASFDDAVDALRDPDAAGSDGGASQADPS
jgi:Lon-like protease